MVDLPMTTHEKELIAQIHDEVNELNEAVKDLMSEMDKTADLKDVEKIFGEIATKSKAIRERSIEREKVIRAVVERLTKLTN